MRIVSGIQASGRLHLGNYYGALRQFLELQREGHALYFIADLHALTTVRNGAALREFTRDAALAYLALGLDPQAAIRRKGTCGITASTSAGRRTDTTSGLRILPCSARSRRASMRRRGSSICVDAATRAGSAKAVKDSYLAEQAEQIERRAGLSPQHTRDLIRELVCARYILPE